MELWGYENFHSIEYPERKLGLSILATYTSDFKLTNDFSELYETGICRPPVVGYVNYNGKHDYCWNFDLFYLCF